MQTETQFRISQESIVLTPKADGFDSLVHCLQSGTSIVARQFGKYPVLPLESRVPYLYCESSGTSGCSKSIRRQPVTWIRSFEINRRIFGVDSSDTYAIFGHLGHSLSLFATLEALHIGANIASLSKMRPKNQVHRAVEEGVSIIYATPSQLRLFTTGAKALDLSKLLTVRRLLVGGGKLDRKLRLALIALFPMAEIREFYGASETSFITISDEKTPDGSVGKPYPEVSIKIGSGDSMEPFVADEIWVSSPYLFDGYETGGNQDTRQEGDYLSVGDIGYVDHHDYLFLLGRKNRMVTVADVNVYPEEIERIISCEPEVSNCVAMPQFDESRGNCIVAIIEGSDRPGLEKKLRQRCRKELDAPAIPRRFIFLDKIPMLPVGKPDIQMLHKVLEHMV